MLYAFVEFEGDTRKLAALAIEASTGERVDNLDLITNPEWVPRWRGKFVGFFCRNNRLLHLYGDSEKHRPHRPWDKAYPDAFSLAKAAGVKIIRQLTWEEYRDARG